MKIYSESHIINLNNGKQVICGNIRYTSNNPINTFISVHLYSQALRKFVKSTNSDKRGRYVFKNIDFKKGPFFIVAHDLTGKNNAVIADNIGGPNYVDD